MDKIFTGVSTTYGPSWMVPGLPINKSSMREVGRIEFCKIFSATIKYTFAHDLVRRSNMVIRRCLCDQNRNRKLIRVTYQTNIMEQTCVDLRDYITDYLIKIWHRAQATDYRHAETWQFHQDGGGRHIEFRKKSQYLRILWRHLHYGNHGHVTKHRNRNLIHMTSLNERRGPSEIFEPNSMYSSSTKLSSWGVVTLFTMKINDVDRRHV